ncbi:WcbI family polysaccharide biosynthesis putative acetyltransferase [Asticcacaulis sp. AC402]|uniref:WcbI family polysaccharide biosynthesis putative acetyltransferase n=1 Tax=Asticcacaulis sp. AC402 TaxID=1282361 RepID=UPI0003C3E2EB|nr:WcbI family polysaccharide biosynthesis putative acetyltransferase [Asticcacaulis sp. AC402]ESQ73903.1 hypothetical protein ABAC402_16780 [Asticcacaulis sp. AC402]
MTPCLKISIVGGCQSDGLREATLALLPGSHVQSWHVGVSPIDPPDVILDKIAGSDLVLSQIQPEQGYDVLTAEMLTTKGYQAHFVPTFIFPGFHPDLIYIADEEGLVNAVHCAFHSRIAVAAFLLGLTPQKTLPLYNAVVFNELGFFSTFPAARAAVEQGLSEAGFQSDGLVDGWLRDIGPFMYMANHPHIRVLATLCQQLYARLGLIAHTTPVPSVKTDHLGNSFTWPVYPALAKRLGVPGSNDFQRPAWLVKRWESRKISLAAYLRDLFTFYATLPRHRVESDAVMDVRTKLASLLG